MATGDEGGDGKVIHRIEDLLGPAARQCAYLIVISADSNASIGRMLKLDRSETVLGRGAQAHCLIEGYGISRAHAKVVAIDDGRFQLVDLGSTNGTFHNGLKVRSVPLHDGDKIQIGSNTVLKFSIRDELEEQYQRGHSESATRDGLTRLYNKKFFLGTLQEELSRCLRHRLPLSLVMVDVDHLTRINDVYGHPAGDYVLSRIAQRVSETVRNEDVLARYGGEELALMLRESPEADALACAERCRRAVNRGPFIFAGIPIQVSISLGVATLLDSGCARAEELIVQADAYLRQAKRAGRDRVAAKLLNGFVDPATRN